MFYPVFHGISVLQLIVDFIYWWPESCMDPVCPMWIGLIYFQRKWNGKEKCGKFNFLRFLLSKECYNNGLGLLNQYSVINNNRLQFWINNQFKRGRYPSIRMDLFYNHWNYNVLLNQEKFLKETPFSHENSHEHLKNAWIRY